VLDTGIISFGIGAGAALDGCVIAVHPVPAVGWVVGASEELALLALVRVEALVARYRLPAHPHLREEEADE
jgi:hypothetical protein